jgi:hypothetical protein
VTDRRRTLAGDPLVRALVAAMREIADRRAVEQAERRRRITILGKEDRAA